MKKFAYRTEDSALSTFSRGERQRQLFNLNQFLLKTFWKSHQFFLREYGSFVPKMAAKQLQDDVDKLLDCGRKTQFEDIALDYITPS